MGRPLELGTGREAEVGRRWGLTWGWLGGVPEAPPGGHTDKVSDKSGIWDKGHF